MPESQRHVAIIGGGIAGLSAAYDLAQAGVRHTLIEQQPRLGGVIETRNWELQPGKSCVLECGPDSFISQKPAAMELIRDVGLESEVIGSNDKDRVTYILRHKKLVRLPEGTQMFVPTKAGPMLASPIVGWGTKLRMGLELLRQPTANPDRSVADFVIDHFGQETLDYLAEPLLSGVYGGDPRQLSMASVMPRFVEMERTQGSLGRALLKSSKPARPKPDSTQSKPAPPTPLFRSLKGGLGTLTCKLATFAHVVQAKAESLLQTETGWRIRVTTPDGASDFIEATDLIIACPAWAAAQLLGSVDATLARGLEQIPYTSSAIVSLIYRDDQFDGQRAGTGFLVPKVERDRLMACTFVGTKFPHRVPSGLISLRCFFGGAGNEAVLDQPDKTLVNWAREELRRILKLTAIPVYSTVSRWPRSMAQYTVGHAERLQEIEARAGAVPHLYLAGNAYTGIGIPDCIRMGRAAAKQIIQR